MFIFIWIHTEVEPTLTQIMLENQEWNVKKIMGKNALYLQLETELFGKMELIRKENAMYKKQLTDND